MTAPALREAFDTAMDRHRVLSGAVLFIERAMPRELGLVLTLWSAHVIAALLGLSAVLPGALRVVMLAALLSVSVVLLGKAGRRIGWPGAAARRARLERGGALPMGLLAIGEDVPADSPDALGARLWERALTDAKSAHPRLGRFEWQPRLSTRYGLWPLLATGLLLGLLLAKGDAPARLGLALSPYPVSLADVRIAVGIDAPAYANLPPRRIAIEGGAARDVEALAGSTASFRVSGLDGSWRVIAPGGDAVWASGGTARIALAEGGEYRVKQRGRTIATLKLVLAADGVPVVRLDGPPARTPTGALRIGYRITDDHGAASLSLRVTYRGETRSVDLETTTPGGSGHVFADLTPHPFAGREVELALAATDGAGQTGVSPAIAVTLPKRRFVQPLAQEIIAVRKALLDGGKRSAVIRSIGRIAGEPDRLGDNLAVFTGLRAASWRLVHDRRAAAREGAAAILWDAAVDLEDGGASRAMDDLRTAMERLQNAIGSGDDRAIAAMADDLEKAMGEYLRRQIEAALAEGGEMPPPGSAGASVDLGFLDQMFADLKDRLAAGDAEGAAAALANLRQLMETIRFGNAAPDPDAARRAAEAAAAAQRLRDIADEQQSLRSQSIADMIGDSFSEGDSLREGAPAQSDLANRTRALEGEMRELGMQPPASMRTAEKAMRAAADALAKGSAGDAIRAQTRALEALSQAANAAEAVAERMAQAAGPGAMQPGAAGSGLDPLGRPGQGFGQGAVSLPDQSEVRRIQAIRKILEERASDPARSSEERGYYLRLLKRF